MAEQARQSRRIGEGFKPPKGAMVKSHGIERLGKGPEVSGSGTFMRDERKWTTDEVSRTWYILSKAVELAMQW